MRLLHTNRRYGGNGLDCAYPGVRKGNGAGQISKSPSPWGVGWRFGGSLTMQLADFALKKFDGQLSLTQ